MLPDVTGLLVQPRDARRLALSLRALLVDETRREQFGIAARDRVLGRFSRSRLVKEGWPCTNVSVVPLTHRMATATASIVRAIADAGLTSDEDDLPDQVELLGRMALCAEAMHHADQTARAVVDHGENA